MEFLGIIPLVILFIAYIYIRKNTIEAAQRIIKNHLPVLATKYHQTIRKDEYGNVVTNNWETELDYFYENVLERDIGELFLKIAGFPGDRFDYRTFANNEVINYINNNDVYVEFDEDMSPYDYENFCAQILEENGWTARATQGSGDQGIDVVAEKDGIKLVLQCKLYSKPVGNSAVQQISAGKQHEAADFAAVVSNKGYTPSAQKLASTNSVALLHHSDLNNLEPSYFSS